MAEYRHNQKTEFSPLKPKLKITKTTKKLQIGHMDT